MNCAVATGTPLASPLQAASGAAAGATAPDDGFALAVGAALAAPAIPSATTSPSGATIVQAAPRPPLSGTGYPTPTAPLLVTAALPEVPAGQVNAPTAAAAVPQPPVVAVPVADPAEVTPPTVPPAMTVKPADDPNAAIEQTRPRPAAGTRQASNHRRTAGSEAEDEQLSPAPNPSGQVAATTLVGTAPQVSASATGQAGSAGQTPAVPVKSAERDAEPVALAATTADPMVNSAIAVALPGPLMASPAAAPPASRVATRGSVGATTGGRTAAVQSLAKDAEPKDALPSDGFTLAATDAPTDPKADGSVKIAVGDGRASDLLVPTPANTATGSMPAPGSPFLAAVAQDTKLPVAIAAAHQPVVDARTGQIGHEIGVEIARRLTDGGNELVVRLVPAELGRIEVRMSFDDRGGLRAVIAADSPVALDMLRRDSADLSRSLSDAGVRSDGQSLHFQTDSGGGGNNQQRSPWLAADSRSGRATQSGFADDGEQTPFHAIRTSGRYDLLA